MKPPENDREALTMALMLAITAPDDERAAMATEAAEKVAAGMDETTVETCKVAAAALGYLIDARQMLSDLGEKHNLNGDELFHNAMRSITNASEELGVSVQSFAAVSDTTGHDGT